MLDQGNDRILKQGNRETLEGYPSISLSHFYQKHQNIIKQKLFGELKDNPEYDTARRLIAINEVSKSKEEKMTIFIEMLNKGNNAILKQYNQENFEGYPNIYVGSFFKSNYQQIIQKLFEDEKYKDNPEYNVARQTILEYFKVPTIEDYQQQLKEKHKR